MNQTMRCLAVAAALVFALALDSREAIAHKPSDSYLTFTIGERLVGQWDVALRDLDMAVGLDADGDAKITWRELRESQSRVFEYVLSNLDLRASGASCVKRPTGLRVDRHSDGAYAVLDFEVACPDFPRAIEVGYSLLFERDPQHRGLLQIAGPGDTQTAIFASDSGPRLFELGSSGSRWTGFQDYVGDGIGHIAIGYDHLLFLCSLLLPTVLRREGATWKPVDSSGEALRDAIRVVTAFTVAHSITLGLASFGWLQWPSRWIESAIAASVILAALHNLFPLWDQARGKMAFGFGLVHGLGFASVLGDFGLPAQSLLSSLLGFNFGVEVGQLVAVAVFLPIAFTLRAQRAYQTIGLGLGSVLIVVMGSIWLAERALDLPPWLGFV